MCKSWSPFWRAAALTFLIAAAAHAQEEGAKGSSHGKSWYDLFKTTGIVGWLLLGCSIIGTSLLVQYLMTINKKNGSLR